MKLSNDEAIKILSRYDNEYYTPATRQAHRMGAEALRSQGWIPVTERLPENFISVLGYMTDAGDFPPVRECYTVGNVFYFPALLDRHPVSHWMPMPDGPKEA